MSVENRTRFGKTAKDIAEDFAEQLKYNFDADVYHTTPEGHYQALAMAIRDRIIHQWDLSRKMQRAKSAKRVYYLSLEFLMGRAMTNNIINLGIEKQVKEALSSLGYELEELVDVEPDAGLGNGGLGRLAACFLDSLATLELPAYGYGIRYNYGIFRQQIKNGWQAEQPDNWLKDGNPWELKRPDLVYPVYFGGEVKYIRENGKDTFKWVPAEQVNGMAYDTPIVGYGGKTINTLRLWSAQAPDEFSFSEFNSGDYTEAVRNKISAENISQVLYPNDTGYMGKELRLKQQYFFVACSLADIVRRFKRRGDWDWKNFPNKAAIQLNDTHPSIAVPELMRILIDQEGLSWDEAWELTEKTFGYTNHTLMPEALERWSVPMLQSILPRHMQIIYEINSRFIQKAAAYFPLQNEKIARVSIIEESNPKMVRMANLAIIGSHSTNGVAALHSDLLKTSMFPEFNQIFPERFNNKTNGITQRRWLLDDVQVKRIHEYKRQLMNALNIIMIYDRMKNDEAYRTSFPPTTFLFGGKAAPGYINAKLIIKFINNIARVINSDPQVNKIINVYFMPNYRVTMAEKVIPATNISEQISTAGLEASGTGNMKFMINGALTMGTLDGANVEIAEEAGADNCFIFGHTESQIAALSRDYDPEEWIMADEGIRRAVELVESAHFNLTEPGIFEPLIKSLTEYGDRYKIFADLRMYHDRHNEATDLYRNDFDDWNRKAIINIASSGKFSSDRTIQQYADEIWNIKPCKVKKSTKDSVLEDAYNPKASK